MRMRELKTTIAGVVLALAQGLSHADDINEAVGREIYDSYCGACHGFDGMSLLPNTPSFASGERMKKSDGELLDSIRSGKGAAMPAWAGILSDEQCKTVLRFIRVSVNHTVRAAD